MREIIILFSFLILIISTFLFFKNLSINFEKAIGKALVREKINKLDYYISAFNYENKSKIIIIFNNESLASCIKDVKVDNKSVEFRYEKNRRGFFEIDLNSRLPTEFNIKVYFCNGKYLEDVIII